LVLNNIFTHHLDATNLQEKLNSSLGKGGVGRIVLNDHVPNLLENIDPRDLACAKLWRKLGIHLFPRPPEQPDT